MTEHAASGTRDRLWTPIVPLVIWAIHVQICYVAAAMACGRPGLASAASAERFVTLATWCAIGALVLLTVASAIRYRRLSSHPSESAASRHSFMLRATMGLSVLGIVAIVFFALALSVVGVCA